MRSAGIVLARHGDREPSCLPGLLLPVWLVCHVLVRFPPRRKAGMEVTMSSVLIAVVILMLVVLAEAVHHRFQRERRRKRISACMLGCLK